MCRHVSACVGMCQHVIWSRVHLPVKAMSRLHFPPRPIRTSLMYVISCRSYKDKMCQGQRALRPPETDARGRQGVSGTPLTRTRVARTHTHTHTQASYLTKERTHERCDMQGGNYKHLHHLLGVEGDQAREANRQRGRIVRARGRLIAGS
jgi:hypothetical protein